MSRDYKNLRNNKNSNPEIKNKDGLLSFLIGLILGIFFTSIIFFNQYKKLYDRETTLTTNDKSEIKTKNNDNKEIETNIKFDFPTILEERQVTKIPKKEYAETATNNNENRSHTIYILQVGSFKNFKSADALEAKLAFLGLSAYIQKKDIIGKGISYRVFVGPFENKKELEKIKVILSENNVNSVISVQQKIEDRSM
jgi:cell division protein FtsN